MIERFVGIDHVCAWPNLTRLPDGSIVAAVFNQHCGTVWEADIDCWCSVDGGKTWRFRGTPARHEPNTMRMNCAAGLARNGDLIVISSGWPADPSRGDPTAAYAGVVLPAWVSRSSDGGATWSVSRTFPEAPEANMSRVIPYGDIHTAADGSLTVAGYSFRTSAPLRFERESSYFFRSRDDGQTWGQGVIIGEGDYDECATLHLGDGRWIAAARTLKAAELRQFRSDDDGRTWRAEQVLSLPGQHPAHLARLADGRVLLCYGNRCVGQTGIDVRVSGDEGRTWSRPNRLVSYGTKRAGYPSTVQRGDGQLVTAYYVDGEPHHGRAHMAVVLWEPRDALPAVEVSLG